MDGNSRNMSTQCLSFLGSQLHHRNSWTSSGAAAKRRAKSVVECVAMDPMECCVLATVSAKGHSCSNPPTQPEEDEGDSQQSEVDSDEFAGKRVID